MLFGDAYTLIVEDHSDAVKEVVSELVQLKLLDNFIQDQVTKRVRQHRVILWSRYRISLNKEKLIATSLLNKTRYFSTSFNCFGGSPKQLEFWNPLKHLLKGITRYYELLSSDQRHHPFLQP